MQRPALPMHPSLEGLRQNGPSYARNGAPFRTAPSPLRNNQDFSRFAKKGPDAPYVGFVQRVKNLLEERASMDEPVRVVSISTPKEDFVTPTEIPDDIPIDMPGEYPVDEPQTPSELPASSPNVRRLTRDMIKTAIGSPSDGEHMSTPNLLDSTILVPDEPDPDSSSVLAAESDIETAASSTEDYPVPPHAEGESLTLCTYLARSANEVQYLLKLLTRLWRTKTCSVWRTVRESSRQCQRYSSHT
jgi:hypothetical protein